MKSAPRIALIYGIFGVFWIAVSDLTLEVLVQDPHYMTLLQTLKGWVFVVASSILLYFLVGREVRIRRGAEDVLKRGRELLRTYHETLVDIAKDEGLYNIETKAAFEKITEAASRALAVQRVSIWFSLSDQSGIRCAELFDGEQGAHS